MPSTNLAVSKSGAASNAGSHDIARLIFSGNARSAPLVPAPASDVQNSVEPHRSLRTWAAH
eukprot:1805837-Pyramimonas_sp.AAC.1